MLRGFTLIELLIVIAIIGILASVILASLSTARAKSRDAKRVAEVGQIQKALELYYYDNNQTYPSTTPTGYSGADAGVQVLTANGLLPHTPLPPAGTNPTYIYHGVTRDLTTGALTECLGGPCNNFELGITLERTDGPVLGNDADHTVGAFYGAYPDCLVNTAGTEQCYDIAP
jgi:prepilin-type N-terminal cleavage/methylation domain-containing protein